MFCSLAQGMVPELGEKLSLFIALAPAVYAGPLTTGFPFTALKNMRWKTWRRWFGASSSLPWSSVERRAAARRADLVEGALRAGLLDFIPLMRISYDWVPSRLFGLLGYQMFAFLFSWTDANWVRPRPPSPSLPLPPALRLSLRAPAPAHDALTRPHAPRTQLLDRKAKMFCFMPSPVSSASIFWWTGYAGFSTCVLALSGSPSLCTSTRSSG